MCAARPRESWRSFWRLFVSEAIGTALLVLGGFSVVILMFGDGSPMGRLLPNQPLRMMLSAFLFGTVGSSIALSWVGPAGFAIYSAGTTKRRS